MAYVQDYDLASASGSTMVGFAQSGSGSSTRTLQSKVEEGVLTLQDFGAVGDGSASDAAAFAAALSAAQATNKQVWIPEGVYIIDQQFVVPAGVCLVIEGALQGVGTTGSISVSGSTTVKFYGRGLLRNVQLILTAGGPQILNPVCTGYEHIAFILIEGSSSYKDVLISGARFYEGNFGILRQGAGSTSDGLRILDTLAREIVGDAIELNAVNGDIGTVIDGVDIRTITGSVGQANWGIGVGVAGLSYSADYDAATSAKQFVIRNVRGSSLRQLVHVECATDFLVDNVQGYDVSTAYSADSGLPCATVAIYGCARFNVSNIQHNGPDTSDGGLLMLSGVTDESYTCPCSDFVLNDVNLIVGSLQADVGGHSALFRGLVLTDGLFRIVGRSVVTRIENTHVTRASAAGTALVLDCDGVGDGRDAFLPTNSTLYMRAWSARSETGSQSWTPSIGDFSTTDIEPVVLEGTLSLTTDTPDGQLFKKVGSSIAFTQGFLSPPRMSFELTDGVSVSLAAHSASSFTPRGLGTANSAPVTATWTARGLPA